MAASQKWKLGKALERFRDSPTPQAWCPMKGLLLGLGTFGWLALFLDHVILNSKLGLLAAGEDGTGTGVSGALSLGVTPGSSVSAV